MGEYRTNAAAVRHKTLWDLELPPENDILDLKEIASEVSVEGIFAPPKTH
jgi:hypothetical protein